MSFRWRRQGLLCATVVAVVAGVAVGAIPAATASPQPTTTVVASRDHYSAVIRRTEFGIPHVLGDNFGDVGYGYGYAFAQDNICTLADLVLTVDGDRSRYLGPTGEAGNPFLGAATNLDSDVFYRWINDSGIVGQTFDQPAPLGLDDQARQIMNGYVAGVNRYLANTGVADLPDPTCRAKPWVHPISVLEAERITYSAMQKSGIGSFPTQIAEATPAVNSSARMRLPVMNPSDSGSNGIGVGRAGTADGGGVLLANPHLPWAGADRLYQIQMTIPGVLDLTGASQYGTPVIEIGHNRTLAWTHTASTAQRITLYELHLVPGDPTSYLVDGQPEAMVRHPISVPVPGGGTMTRTVFTSRYGPVLNVHWTTSTALAVRGANQNNGRALNEWLAIGQANSVAQLQAAQNHYQGNPFDYTIAVDSGGTAYFRDASVVPHVTDDQIATCVDSPFGKALLSQGRTTLDGSLSACAWGSSPDAVIPGIFGPSTDPTLTRTDFVMNSNNSFWLTNPAAPITGIPQIYGDTGTARSLRTRLGLNLIDQRLAGTDGFGPPGFTVPTLQQALLSDRDEGAELARDGAVAMCTANPTLTASDGTTIDVSAACPVLAAWDTRNNPDSRGAVLWRQFWTNARQSPNLWTVPFDPAHPVTTPNTLNTADPTVRAAFADAVERMRALHLPLDEPLSAAQFTDIGGQDVVVPGCPGPDGCYNAVEGLPAGLQSNGQLAPIAFGSSFIMAADIPPHGTSSARTILTYSESASPASPHHNDQTVLFSAKKWVTDRYTEHDIMSDPQLTITVLAGH